MKTKAMLIMAGTVILLFAGLARTADVPPKTETPKHTEKEPGEAAAGENAEGKDAQYFTQETLKEMLELEKFKNSKLWACYLLTTCKMKLEQVLGCII